MSVAWPISVDPSKKFTVPLAMKFEEWNGAMVAVICAFESAATSAPGEIASVVVVGINVPVTDEFGDALAA